ncbi:alpha/beta hydrolase [Hymenobacter sediminis]|uniref:alpha/beta fold hydrolase n=1 Tax=Hymenobacter sediminis TaxID=2218621 RepID=UPI000DA6A7FD|nr:alpha/beta hydrolase [Hymenobacter sediminis]RPD48345.1 alpha/beta hydrolase [Hymenobacter sediminis]
MFDFIHAWKSFWHPASEPAARMPLTENDPGEQIPYPYPVKKVRLPGQELDIAYIDVGPQDAEVLVLVHGMGGGIPTWRKNLEVLKKQFRCLALDLPGHGYSSKGDYPYTISFYTDVVLSFINALGVGPVTLVGHSMGGQTAIMAGLREPNLIQKLILVSPAGVEPYTSVEKQLLINMSAGVVATGNAFTKNRLNFLIGFCNNAELAGDLAKRLAFFKEDAAVFGRAMQRSIEGMLLESLNHSLTEIRQPCLLLVGKDDKLSPYQYLRGQEYYQIVVRESAKIPHGHLVVVPRCGHFVQYQCPEAFNTEVLEFLKEKKAA